jgi:dolichol-phosphate mannosyltransferase
MDGNGKDGIEGINTIKQTLDQNYDFVQGSRFIKGGESHNTPVTRYLAIRFLHAPIISLAAKFWYTDTTNGFRGHSMKFIGAKEVNLFRDIFDSYELLAYLPICARQLGYSVTEVPVRRSYPATGEIPTKIKGIRGQFLVLRILIGAVCKKYN